jgi:hypothetical protein
LIATCLFSELPPVSSLSSSDLSLESLVTVDVPILYTDCAKVGFGAGDSANFFLIPFAEQREVRGKAAEKLCA